MMSAKCTENVRDTDWRLETRAVLQSAGHAGCYGWPLPAEATEAHQRPDNPGTDQSEDSRVADP